MSDVLETDLRMPARLDVEGARQRLAAGRLVALRDAGDPPGRHHLLLAGQFATARRLRALSRRGRGELRLALTSRRWAELGPELSGRDTLPDVEGAPARLDELQARFVRRVLGGAATGLVGPPVPGLRLVPTAAGGVLSVAEPAEAAVDLLRMAECLPVAVLTEVRDAAPDRGATAAPADLGVLPLEAVTARRLLEDALVERVVAIRLPTCFGEFSALGYGTSLSEREYVVLVRGELGDLGPGNVHLHFGCLYGDVFRSRACACGARLERRLESVAATGGAIVYVRTATDCADRGADPPADPDGVDRHVAGLILRDLGVEPGRIAWMRPPDGNRGGGRAG